MDKTRVLLFAVVGIAGVVIGIREHNTLYIIGGVLLGGIGGLSTFVGTRNKRGDGES